jgi:hypothetical protein
LLPPEGEFLDRFGGMAGIKGRKAEYSKPRNVEDGRGKEKRVKKEAGEGKDGRSKIKGRRLKAIASMWRDVACIYTD